MTYKNPIVYIILPVYNWENFLLQQLMSIYFQDYKNRHLIIINDWSTDSTNWIINKFILDYKLKEKITLINQPNKWLNKSIENWLIEAKNIIKSSKNKNSYITYCDSDDLMMTNRLSYQINYMEKHKNCDLSYHDLILIDKDNAIINLSYIKQMNKELMINIYDDSFFEFCIWNHIPATTIMYKSSFINNLIPFPNKFPYQDWRTALIFSSNNLCIKRIWIPLWYYRRYSHQMSDKQMNREDYKRRYKEFIESLLIIKKNINSQKTLKEINYFIKFYTRRIKRIEKKYNWFIQKILIILLFPKVFSIKLLSITKKI